MNFVQKKRGDELRKRPECTEKRKAGFIQGDGRRPVRNLSMTARENCGYFFPKTGLSVRFKIRSIWVAAPRCRKIRQNAAERGGRRRKIWKASKGVWKTCNPLKYHKTAKDLFGKAWSKTREFWRSLEKRLEGAFIPPPLAPATNGLRSSWIVIAKAKF